VSEAAADEQAILTPPGVRRGAWFPSEGLRRAAERFERPRIGEAGRAERERIDAERRGDLVREALGAP
jgi:hypothetical protein